MMVPDRIGQLDERLAALEARASREGGLRALLDEVRAVLRDAVEWADEQHARREAAEVEAARYRALIEGGPDAYLVTDHRGVVVEANAAAARLLGLGRTHLITKPLAVFVDRSGHPEFWWRLNHLSLERSSAEWTIRLRPRGGRAFDAPVVVTAFTEGEGGPLSLRWLVRDVSDRRRAEELAVARDFTQEVLVSEQRARVTAEAS